MDKATIIEVLEKWSPWKKKLDAGIKRTCYVEKIHACMARKEILVLKGIRRSGKSTIMRQLVNELMRNEVDARQIAYLNLDDYNFANDLNIALFDDVLAAYKKHTGNRKKTYLFIDEVQKIKGWEKWVRTKYDLGDDIKFVVSGSSASLLSKELSTLLTGRNLSFKIMPLSFREFLEFRKDGSLEEYLEFGGFPEVVLEKDADKKLFLLRQYFEDIIHKDIIDRYNVRNARQLVQLARYLISAAGSKVSLNKLSKVFGLSNDTLALYVGYMTDAYLLFEVPYFSYSVKTRHDVTKLPKLYVLDDGLINVVSVKYSKSRGQMFENTALIKLSEEFDEVSYWSELKSEVDFIAGKTAINVTATDEIPEREMKGLNDFRKKHPEFRPLLVTGSTTKDGAVSLASFLKTGVMAR